MLMTTAAAAEAALSRDVYRRGANSPNLVTRWKDTPCAASSRQTVASWPREAPPAPPTSTITTTPGRCTAFAHTGRPACASPSIPSCRRPQPPATGPVRSRCGTEGLRGASSLSDKIPLAQGALNCSFDLVFFFFHNLNQQVKDA